MTAKNYKKQLAELRKEIVINPEWKQAQRDILFTKISAQQDNSQLSLFTPWMRYSIHSLARPFAGLAMLLVFVFGGAATVWGSFESMPGDVLYPVKITTERLQVTLIQDEDKKADLKMKYAQKRVAEIKVLTQATASPKKQEALANTVREYNKTIAEVQATVQRKANENNPEAIALAKTLNSITNEVTVTLAGVIVSNPNAQQALNEAKESTQKAQQSAVVTIVKKSENKEEAKQVLQKYLDSKTAQTPAETAASTVTLPVEPTAVTPEEEQTESAEATFALQPLPVVKTSLDEAKELLESGDLEGAIEKLEEAPAEEVVETPAEPVQEAEGVSQEGETTTEEISETQDKSSVETTN